MDNTTYQTGDVANGHRLGEDGQWVPAQAAPVDAAKPSRRGRKLVLAGVGAVVPLGVIAACSAGTTGTNSDAKARENARAAAAPADPAPDAAENEPAEPAAPSMLAIGQAFTWQDGVTAIVTGITDGTGPSYDPKPVKVVTVQVQNGAAVPVDLGLSSAKLAFGPAGQQAIDELSSSANLAGFEGSVPPGGTLSANFGFSGVTDASTMTVEFAPTWDHQPAFWKQ